VTNSKGESEPDWIGLLVDRTVEVVQRIRSVATQPAVTASRAIVYGLVAAVCLIAALVLVGLGLFRLADLALPGGSWVVHLCAGGLLCLLGILLWNRRSAGQSVR
jgi:hypothetical protein